MIQAGMSELRVALHRHSTPDPLQSHSRSLLLFYAAECGLKAAWLKRNKLRSTSQLTSAFNASIGHDLMLWAKKLALPAALASAPGRFRLKRDNSAFETAAAHQAWRYGVEILAVDETVLTNWLQALCQWAKGELSR
jgi:hypothetical protein